MQKLFVYIVACATMSGCASIQTASATRQVGSFPEIGKTITVSTGQVMVTKYDYLSVASATLLEKVDGSFWAGRRDVPAGSKLMTASSSGHEIYCFPPLVLGAPCFWDSTHSGKFDKIGTMNAYGFLTNGGGEITPVAYRLADQTIQDGFKYELLYEGVDNGVARIAYREYTDNVARPAFAQDVTYTLASDGATQAKFREVAMKILRADNSSIEYVVESGF